MSQSQHTHTTADKDGWIDVDPLATGLGSKLSNAEPDDHGTAEEHCKYHVFGDITSGTNHS